MSEMWVMNEAGFLLWKLEFHSQVHQGVNPGSTPEHYITTTGGKRSTSLRAAGCESNSLLLLFQFLQPLRSLNANTSSCQTVLLFSRLEDASPREWETDAEAHTNV